MWADPRRSGGEGRGLTRCLWFPKSRDCQTVTRRRREVRTSSLWLRGALKRPGSLYVTQETWWPPVLLVSLGGWTI